MPVKQWEPKGYDDEEMYFHQQEMELLAKKRAELDAKAAEQAQHEHWMKCPKCGKDMKEVDMQHIRVDRCNACGGTFFDRGEVEALIGSVHPHKVGAWLARIFRS
ncbi:MAG: hypothetical protein CMJ21_00825 [Phycisphaerae bacterium]|jgi:hypothetical protein|nr:hypothetical protein [Phycisphaerae bacterium]